MDPITENPTFNVLDMLNNQNKAKERKISADFGAGGMTSQTVEKGDDKLFREASKSLGKQDFLNLLVTQMRFQDPLNPSENTEFVAQLAQFSSLEGTQNINSSIEKLAANLESMVRNQSESAATLSNASATSLIGKQVRANIDTINVTLNRSEPIAVNIHSDRPGAIVSFVNSDNKAVAALAVDNPGEAQVKWNGVQMDGTPAPPGTYTVRVTSPDGMQDAGYPYMEGTAEAVEYHQDKISITVNGQPIALSDVVRVGITAAK